MGYNYRLYKKHRAARKWEVVGMYPSIYIAREKAEEIKRRNKYMVTMIRKIKTPYFKSWEELWGGK